MKWRKEMKGRKHTEETKKKISISERRTKSVKTNVI